MERPIKSFRVQDAEQDESPCRGRRPGEGPVSGTQELADPPGRAATRSDFHEAPDDIPHHVVEKAVCREEQSYELTTATKSGREGLTDGTPGPSGSRAERGEVVGAPEKAERDGHGGPVERLPDLPGVSPEQRGGHRAVFDEVPIALRPCPAAGVKARRGFLDHEDTDLSGEQSIEPRPNLQRSEGAGGGQAGDLPKGVNTGVGSAGSGHLDRFPEDLFEGFCENPLDGGPAGLDLPAVEGRAVVPDEKPECANTGDPATGVGSEAVIP